MKTCIFAKMISMVALGAIMGGAYIAYPAHAVIDNTGCDKEDNLYINPDLALCSTHVYNIGLDNNPDNSAQRQLMQDVVALKTTLITQQMYSQYEILETTVKRLRTQLEKEVLLQKLKAAGAISGNDTSGGESGGAGSSGDKYVVLSGTTNCLQTTNGDQILALQCIQRNLTRVNDALAAGNTGDAKRQLIQDLKVAQGIGFQIPTDADPKISGYPETAIDVCKDLKNAKKEQVSNCATQYNFRIGNKLREMQTKNTQQRNNQGYY